MATMTGSGAHAQETPSPAQGVPDASRPAAQGDAEPESSPPEQEIVVTGSRVAKPGANPVQAITAQTLLQSGKTNVTDILKDLPALATSRTSANTAGSAIYDEVQGVGLNLLDLRGLGVNRTLVLVNGRRHVAGAPGTAGVDINAIPSTLIERVDVLTGGASAIYGADAVTGVVNFILNRHFTGISLEGDVGISERGDGGRQRFAITAGHDFAGSRGNVALSYEYNLQDRLPIDSRPYLASAAAYSLQRNPNYVAGQPGSYRYGIYQDVRYAGSAPDAAVDFDGDGIPEFTGSGQRYDGGRLLGGGFTRGGSGSPIASYDGDLIPLTRQHNVNALTSFEVSTALRLFAEGKYVHAKSFTVGQPNFESNVYLEPDNAFLRERFGDVPDGAYYSRDNFDMPRSFDRSRRQTLRGVVGADGRLSGHLKYEASLTYGQVTSLTTKGGVRFGDRYFAAIDAVRQNRTGTIACRSSIDPTAPFSYLDTAGNERSFSTFTPGPNSGCLPLNILGSGGFDPRALAWVFTNPQVRAKITQTVASGSLSGDTGGFFRLPGGPVTVALGAEYRRETSRSTPDQSLVDGDIYDIGPFGIDRGSFDVKEVFGEVSLPLLSKTRFADELQVGAAVRFSDYSTIGTATTWKVDGLFAPISDLKLRGSYSRSVRAPNINELFAGAAQRFATSDDPCDPANLDLGTSSRPANCVALLGGLGLTPAQIAAFAPNSLQSAGISKALTVSGNPDLRAERATTWTAGVVLQPRFLPGFTMSADWYDIALRDAISISEGNEIVELCVDQPSIDNLYCSAVRRNTNPASVDFGVIQSIASQPQNVARFRASGLDVTVRYTLNSFPALGSFALNVVGGYRDRLSRIATPGAEPEDLLGPQPRYTATGDLAWNKGALTIDYGLNWQSHTHRFSLRDIADAPDIAPPDLLRYKERWEHDIYVGLNVGDRLTLYGGINNFTDQKPDRGSTNIPVSPLGRAFFMGAKAKLK